MTHPFAKNKNAKGRATVQDEDLEVKLDAQLDKEMGDANAAKRVVMLAPLHRQDDDLSADSYESSPVLPVTILPATLSLATLVTGRSVSLPALSLPCPPFHLILWLGCRDAIHSGLQAFDDLAGVGYVLHIVGTPGIRFSQGVAVQSSNRHALFYNVE